MRFDPDALTLRFGSRDEIDRFHRDLTALLRAAIAAGAAQAEDPAEGAAHAQETMRAYATVTRALNALRGGMRDDPR